MARMAGNGISNSADPVRSLPRDMRLDGLSLKSFTNPIRKLTSGSLKVAKAFVAPTPKNILKAGEQAPAVVQKNAGVIGQAVGAAIAVTVPGAGPVIGNFVAAGGNLVQANYQAAKAQLNAQGQVEYYDANGGRITKEQYDALMAAPAPEAAAPLPSNVIPMGQARSKGNPSPSPAPTAPAAATAAAPAKTDWVKIGAGVIVVVKLASLALG